MALTNKLTTIANAIRSKTGKTVPMTLDEMPIEIENITTEKEDLLLPIEYPDYVRTEAQRVASEVRKVLKNDSIVYIAMSDTHYYGGIGSYSTGLQNDKCCNHGLMAIKALSYMLPINFLMHTGDVSWGAGDTNVENIKKQIEGLVSRFKEGSSTLPVFICIGNHDTNHYYHDAMNAAGNTGLYTLEGSYLFDNFTKHSDSENTVFGGEDVGGYCYRDFPDKKLRVFVLNSMDYMIANAPTAGSQKLGDYFDKGASDTQQLWIAQALQELNTKADAADWGFIVMCHYPMDYGDSRYVSKVFMQYVNGGSITINDTTINFSGKNGAKFICQHHGHVHNFLVDKLHALNGGKMEEYDAWRIGIPNAQYNRENYYGEVYGISFKQDETYNKTLDTEEDTSFVVNVINRSEEKIYSFHYGAGYDRVIGIGSIKYFGITKTLTNATLSNDITSIEEGQSYSANITIESGCELKSIVVTMNGIDITDDVYSGGVITIPKVTGNISITIKAQARANFRNLVPISINSDGTPYGTNGYTTGNLISSDGNIGTTSMQQYVVTGFIPIDTILGKVIRVAGEGVIMDGSDIYHRIAVYDSSFTKLGYVAPLGGDNGIMTHPTSNSYGNVIEESSSTFAIQIHSGNWTASNWGTAAYFRIGCTMSSANISPDNLIVTVDQEITYGGTDGITYFVTEKFANVASTNSVSSVVEGDSYKTILKGRLGYTLSFVTITMGDIDITSDVFDLNTGEVSIDNVTGDIIITASATANTYKVVNNLSNVISNNNESSINHGLNYTATLSAITDYKISSVKVVMGNIDVTSSVYNSSTGKITIPSVTNDITITATAIEATYGVTYNLNGVDSSNTFTAVQGKTYSTTLTAEDGIKSVIVTMGGINVTSSVYDSNTGVISIATVTGDIVITAEANINLLTLAVDLDGSPYNEGKGYKTGWRISTSTGDEKEQVNMCCSGFIPVSPNQTLRLYNVGNAKGDNTNGWNDSNILRYFDLGKTKVNGQVLLTGKVAEADGSLRIAADELVLSNHTLKYIRITCSYLGDDTKIYVE